MQSWFVFLIPGMLLLMMLLVVLWLMPIFTKHSPYSLVASIAITETIINQNGGVIRLGNSFLFVETYGFIIDKGSSVLIVKYVPEKEIYMIEPYV